MYTISHHGRSTAYEFADRDGGGMSLLCIHGSGGTSALWSPQLQLTNRTGVARLDLSGHGRSDDVNAAPGIEALNAYADDTIAVARATDADVLVGASLGGAVALWTALERDLDVKGLVLTGTGPRLPVNSDLLRMFDDDFEGAVKFLHDEERLFYNANSEFVERSREIMLSVGQAVTQRDFQTCHRFDVRDRLGDIDLPISAIVGEHDPLTPIRYHRELAELMPDCTLRVVSDAAHLVMLDRPDQFNAAVYELLERV